jgi:hypothetical protein
MCLWIRCNRIPATSMCSAGSLGKDTPIEADGKFGHWHAQLAAENVPDFGGSHVRDAVFQLGESFAQRGGDAWIAART